MGVATLETERRLPFTPSELCGLVGDVRSYPQFIPWVRSLAVEREERVGAGWKGLARAVVGWKTITESFATHVTCAPERNEVDVRLAEGPFRTLNNRWRFEAAPGGGTIVRFWIAYEFKNPFLQALVRANGALAADRIVRAFEAEAHRRFAPVSSGDHAPQQA